MNYIRHLNAFFSFVKSDTRLASSHVSLYMALFQYWNLNRFQNPFPVYRDTMMKLSKIGSKNTYHKCIKELHKAQYILYHPANSKYQPVKISMIRLDVKEHESSYKQLDLFTSNLPSPSGEGRLEVKCTDIGTVQVPNLTDTSTNNDTTQVPKMGHSLKPNILKQGETPAHKIFELNKKTHDAVNDMVHVPNLGHTNQSVILSTGEGSQGNTGRSRSIPSLSEIEEFFQQQNYPSTEAKKFYNHYKAIGWKIQGITPIEDWKALADKWMENAKKWNKDEQPAAAGKSSTDIKYLYQSFLQGKKIFQLIECNHFNELQLQFTEQLLHESRQERINQVSGTNQHSLNQLWQAYLTGDPQSELLQKDHSNLIALAKRMAVLKYFHEQQQAGITVLVLLNTAKDLKPP